MPAESALTALGHSMLERFPAFMRRDPDVLGIVHPQAKEIERLEERIELVRRCLFPHLATGKMLALWEAVEGLTSEPAGQTVEQRQQTVRAHMRKLLTSASGIDWQALMTLAVGPMWEWLVHSGEPLVPILTVLVKLPFPPETTLYERNRTLARQITQAHVALTVSSTEGFMLDESQLDVDVL